jgi:hypothetical protein
VELKKKSKWQSSLNIISIKEKVKSKGKVKSNINLYFGKYIIKSYFDKGKHPRILG